jgi:general secretion pathway protein M
MSKRASSRFLDFDAMSINNTAISRNFRPAPYVAAIGYGALLLAFAFLAWGGITDVLEERAAVAAATDVLGQMEGRSPPPSAPMATADVSLSTGSAFLEGATVTVAGAALLQRVARAVARRDGNILSSQVDLEGVKSNASFVGITVNCEIEEPRLQQLLYDLEAGMPFIFVDQLVVQAPVVAAGAPGGKMRVLLGVSSQWQGAK